MDRSAMEDVVAPVVDPGSRHDLFVDGGLRQGEEARDLDEIDGQ